MSAKTKPDKDVLLAEYTALKYEAAERIKQRDHFVYLNITAIGATVAFVLGETATPYALLVVPWISMSLGWAYLANDDKVSALGNYVEHGLGAKLGSAFLWECGEKRSTNLKRQFRWAQFMVDLSQFVLPAFVIVAIAFSSVLEFPWWAKAISVVECVLASGLGFMFFAHSKVCKMARRWDLPAEVWRNRGM